MKVAIPTRGNVVDDHFGHCEAYTVFTVNENKKIEKTEILPSPQGCGQTQPLLCIALYTATMARIVSTETMDCAWIT